MGNSVLLDGLRIRPVGAQEFDDFLRYLNDHLSDNGASGQPYFQPMSRSQSRIPAELAQAFRQGLELPLGAPGWRRLWVAQAADGRPLGHIDLRARPEPPAAHRCLLGMGVDRKARRMGLGQLLINHARQWARSEAGLEWIDLQVLSVNLPAIQLYQRCGFVMTGELHDMFRIDGLSLAFTSMSLKLADEGMEAV
ncbi:GNAT family N-acetyltransferase [Pseudoduganella sp. FT93W]|uniref:GNAT family N-acetyltransferase n=1 Tax=Duganella fentianensis TaxID=2692177 RepID=A0A845I0Y3_9BURK|nr:GNAT family N-acetyltransferase [Duganella fentianensis]MYN47160.1 GNAT family N-acetyltransferase [Duganella fentianensis]